MAEPDPSSGAFNPYQAPLAELSLGTVAALETVDGRPPERMVDSLRQTGPWVLFQSIVGFLSCAFMALSGVTLVALSPLMDRFAGDKAFGPLVFVWLALFYLGGAAAYALSSTYLVRFFTAIGRVTRTPSLTGVAEALSAQRRFWKVTAITICAAVAACLGLGLALAITVAAAASGAGSPPAL